jgi:hypothetical protein
VERAAAAKRTANDLIRQMQEIAKEVERLKARRGKGEQSRRKSSS